MSPQLGRRAGTYFLTAAAMLSLTRPAAAAEPTVPSSVVASGVGEVFAPPDQAVVRLGVRADAPTASAAQKTVSSTMHKVVEAIRKRGIPDRQIATERLELEPVYAQPTDRRSNDTPRLVGYRAVNVVRVELDLLVREAAGSRIGAVLDAATTAGANTVEGIHFELKSDDKQQSAALAKASVEARSRARTIANALGLELGPLLEATTGSVSQIDATMAYAGRSLKSMGASVSPGELSISAQVQARFAAVPKKK